MIKSFVVGSSVMLVLDYLWLSIIAKSFFIEHIGRLMNMKNGVLEINYVAATAVYLALIVGILTFVMPKVTSLSSSLCYGALFGLITYAIYDLTNLAILKEWPLVVCLVDIAWGTFLGSVTTVSIYLCNKAL